MTPAEAAEMLRCLRGNTHQVHHRALYILTAWMEPSGLIYALHM